MDEKVCTGCRRTLPLSEFVWKHRATGRRAARCRECGRAYQRRWYEKNAEDHRERSRVARRRRYVLNRELVNRSKDVECADCNLRFHPEQMEFDHVRGNKSFNIGDAMWSRSDERLRQEIAKCEVVCSVCHRIRTTERARG